MLERDKAADAASGKSEGVPERDGPMALVRVGDWEPDVRCGLPCSMMQV